MFWSSDEAQRLRFEILCEIFSRLPPGENDSLLDVGCGFGDLSRFLSESGFSMTYQGIDVAPDMVASAGFKYPGLAVRQGDIFDPGVTEGAYDWVLLSGALNERVDDAPAQAGDYARAVIKKMYQLARFGVAFNLLDARNSWVNSRPDLQAFEPDTVVRFCRAFASRVEWRDDYLDNDFTVYLLK